MMFKKFKTTAIIVSGNPQVASVRGNGLGTRLLRLYSLEHSYAEGLKVFVNIILEW